MTRYIREFEGIPSEMTTPGGLDPNYRDGYQGMRMRTGPGQAAYGAYRFLHRAELGTVGGFEGIHGGRSLTPGQERLLGVGDLVAPEDRDGAVVPTDDPEFLRDFDSRGIRFSTGDGSDGR